MGGLTDSASSLGELISRRITFRHYASILSLLLAVLAYYFVINSFDPDRNVVLHILRTFRSDTYMFCSGSPGGFYIEIGKNLEDRAKRDDDIDIINRSDSTGGQWNLDVVSSTPKSMGLTQWDTINADINSEKKKQIKAIGPLYREHMHIIYDVDAWKKHVKENATEADSPAPERIHISKKCHDTVISFFKERFISIGPPRSGTQKFTNGVLDTARLDAPHAKQLGFHDAFEELTEPRDTDEATDDNVDVIFSIAGAPLPEVKDYFEAQRFVSKGAPSPRIAFASIDNQLVEQLVAEHAFHIRGDSFEGLYRDSKHATTFAADAYLITYKSVPNNAILKVLELIMEARADIRSQLGIRAGARFQLDDTSFYDHFKSEHNRVLLSSLQDFVLFAVTVTVTAIGALTFLLWMQSSRKKIKYLRDIEAVSRECVPENTTLNENTNEFPRPVVYEKQTEIVSQIVRGIKQLLTLTSDMHTDHANGSITVGHYGHLTKRLATTKEHLQRSLQRRIYEHLCNGGTLDDQSLRHYYTADYLGYGEYVRLRDLLERPARAASENGQHAESMPPDTPAGEGQVSPSRPVGVTISTEAETDDPDSDDPDTEHS